MIFAVVSYLLGVQLPTAAINIPLNNKLQTMDIDAMDEAARREPRDEFEPRWSRWNQLST